MLMPTIGYLTCYCCEMQKTHEDQTVVVVVEYCSSYEMLRLCQRTMDDPHYCVVLPVHVKRVMGGAEHHVVAELHYHVEEEVQWGVVHHDIVDNSWVVVDHDYYIQEVLLHVGNLGVVVHSSRLTVLALLEAVDHDYTPVLLHAGNFAVVVHNDHYQSIHSETAVPLLHEAEYDIHVLRVPNFGVVDRVDEAAVEQVLLRVANYGSILVVVEAVDREVVVAAYNEVEDRSSLSSVFVVEFFFIKASSDFIGS